MATKICPYNPAIIPNDAYIPAELYLKTDSQTDVTIASDTPSSDLVTEPTTTVVSLDLVTPAADGIVNLPLSVDENGTLSILESSNSDITVQSEASSGA